MPNNHKLIVETRRSAASGPIVAMVVVVALLVVVVFFGQIPGDDRAEADAFPRPVDARQAVSGGVARQPDSPAGRR